MLLKLVAVISALLVCAVAAPAFARETLLNGRYEVLDGTASPDGRYVIAWGIRNRAHTDFTRLDKDRTGDYADSVGLWDRRRTAASRVVNVIFDRRRNRVVTRLIGCDYSPGISHGSLNPTWQQNQKLVAVVYGAKWFPASICVARYPSSGRHDEIDIYNGSLRPTVLHYLRRHGGIRYHRMMEADGGSSYADRETDLFTPAVELEDEGGRNEIEWHGDELRLQFFVSITKHEEYGVFHAQAVYRIQRTRRGISARFVRFQKQYWE